LIWIPALFDEKLKLGTSGRKETFDILESNFHANDRVIWMHVASLGEFEQGRPVLQQLKSTYPDHKILLSFFSPSGYEPRKNYEHADVVCYLPLDTQNNAKRFLSLAHPELVIFVKYEFWPNYLKAIKSANCTSILISTVIGSNNKILKYWPSWFQEMMDTFDHILTQDHATLELLISLKLKSNIQVAGDTRIDRTLSIAQSSKELPEVRDFCGNQKTLIAGSSWPLDELHLHNLYKSNHFDNWKMIIAPHDISERHIDQIMSQFANAVRYSQINDAAVNHRVLVIDNIGLLSQIYRYGHIAFIGGGFGSGIHNILEPAAFHLPVIFGPKYKKFVEAKTLIQKGGAFSISNETDLINWFSDLSRASKYDKSSKAIESYMEENRGATEDVFKILRAVKLLH